MKGPRVTPDVLWTEKKDAPRAQRDKMYCILGALYVVATGIGAVVSLVIIAPNVSNDNLWPNMNTTGVQTFLGDLYNVKLATDTRGTFDLFAVDAALPKDYSSSTTFVDMRPAANRALLLSRLSLDQAIKVVRSVPFSENIQTMSMPCWADLNRKYEMAHTARHQALCNQHRAMNAAFYVEALFRNLGPTDLTTSTYLSAIQTSIFDYVHTTPGGTLWVQTMLHPTWLAIPDEVTLWQSLGLEYFQNSFQNYYLEGTQESITIINAMGMRQGLTISSFTAANRPKTMWSSVKAYPGFWNDIDACAWFQASAIRAAPNNFEIIYGADWESWDYYYIGVLGTEATSIIRTSLGPLTLIDVFLIPPPPILLDLVAAYQRLLNSALLEGGSTGYFALSEPPIDVSPPAWIHPGALYYGGNPLCPFGQPKSFVQASFGYYDDCGAQFEHTLQLKRGSLLFAILTTGIQQSDITAICRLSSHNDTCIQVLSAAMKIFNNLVGTTSAMANQIEQALEVVHALNITFVQWATINNSNVVLHQPMVSTSHDPWSFIGWMTMYEWVMGQREVYTFEGDWDIWTLMSRHHDLIPFAANAVELPQSAIKYLWYVCIYVSFVLALVLLLALAFGTFVARFDMDGRNLFFSNRLIGGAWIGRPFLLVRGVTSILLLATSPVVFHSYSGFAKLDFVPRPLWHTMLLAGEVTWVSYVLNDILLPITKPHSATYAPLSSFITWLVVFAIEWTDPYKAVASIGRKCFILSFSRGLQCSNGDIRIGNEHRTLLLGLVSVLSVPLAYCIVAIVKRSKITPSATRPAVVSFYLTSSSEAFLLSSPNKLDVAACILSGLIPLGPYLFDIKNWIMFPTDRIDGAFYVLPDAFLEVQSPASALMSMRRIQSFQAHQTRSPSTIRWLGIVGLLYMSGAILSSFLYLFASEAYFANDFLWLGFGDTNTQAFLVNWFNVQLQFANATTPKQIDSPAYGDYATTNKVTQYNVFSSALYPIMIQDEANSLTNVVNGLRTMDTSYLPWIATSFCFADFGKQWQMAFSVERQQRCIQNEGDNGAVYLESILRNANYPSLSFYWGTSFETTIFAPIQNTNNGVSWVNKMKSSNTLPIAAEVEVWRNKGIERYTTMWQNYKTLGVTESFLISNYAGTGYELTLKKSNSSFHSSAATAFKMYSPLANYLTDAAVNNSLMSGKSLIRGTPVFAFANTTTQDYFLANDVLASPMDPLFVIFLNTIGPYGVIDIKRVAAPQNLRDLFYKMRKFLLSKLSSSDAMQKEYWTIYTQFFFLPQPSAWDPPALMWGGDINCGLNFGGNTTFPLEYFRSTGLCGNIFWDFMKPLTQNIWMSILAMGSQTPPNATGVSLRDVGHQSNVYAIIMDSIAMMHKYMSDEEIAQFDGFAMAAKSTIRDKLKLQLIQYLSVDGASFYFSRVNFFTPTEPDFEFFMWLYLLEWVEGKREVISIHGTLDNLTTISSTKLLTQKLTNAIEIPVNVGRFFYTMTFYVTAVLFGVGCVATMYIVSSRGYVDGINVIAFNYVAGHVWIGRPLMLLRSLASVALLSTSELKLIAPGSALTSYFLSSPRDVLTTLVSSGEICWFVYVLIDTFSVFTGEYTAFYSTPSVIFVSVSVAIWSFTSPTTHSIALSRQCTVVAVDLDVYCVSGVVNIGDVNRFGGLVGVACGGCLISYLLVRIFVKQPPRLPPLSPLLYSAAKSEFEHTTHVNWEFEGVYYLDKASAVMTGILTYELQGYLYIADIKTWRVYIIPPKNQTNGGSRSLPPHIQFALPLVTSDVYI
ncbi:Aste57867_11097 [Aphanomyces stellatus]|uniref:Aste57867_11097 protein n=1 Tax=Aphanomyces stellatus TaxID=120398 RepID=A0A485KSK1_9STRA|nr:hypothetical protein As57867_011055 [Aphanomyces stellatus]VFT87964.1 Aste57867_11097 [Aphanomyces stellatus]